ncbi:hypothetical protein NLJ89_g742 [Agrocybe chaxingu]|uniref:HMG box domain-containing protein n=1 Tax=Agrocybe chaxingu TaxID=84603 RepID=A0A9W8N1F6_9AGAR|nr:hypothetical protein NLJ89_g742 [Agrocybe chaxingu]
MPTNDRVSQERLSNHVGLSLSSAERSTLALALEKKKIRFYASCEANAKPGKRESCSSLAKKRQITGKVNPFRLVSGSITSNRLRAWEYLIRGWQVLYMPAQRRSSRHSDASEPDFSLPKAEETDIAFAPTVTPTSFESAPSECSLPDMGIFTFEQDELLPRRSTNSRKKAPNHIPRPPNAFILFRSSFIKSQHVSTGVETNHSTLSKIIGLTWQNLPNEERQKWHALAKVAQDEHKRRFPQYAFRPIHNKSKGPAGERKKLREVGPKDNKRCAKIAELLVRGKTGQELGGRHPMSSTKHHVPEIVTRFETPITEKTFETASSPSRSTSKSAESPSRRRSSSVESNIDAHPWTVKFSPPPGPPPQLSPVEEATPTPTPTPSFETPSFYASPPANASPPSFEFDTFAFSIDQPTSPLHDEALAPAAIPSAPSFNNINSQPQDPSRLCRNPQFPGMDGGWPRSCSPLSNSTASMPTTPMHMTVPFPDQGYCPGLFAPEPASDYPSLEGSYADFTPYPAPYRTQYVPVSEHAPYVQGNDGKELGSGIASGYVQSVAPELSENQVQMSREPLDFSMFMASLLPLSALKGRR